MRRGEEGGYQPELECLEQRAVPAVTVKVLDLDGNGSADLQIIGDNRKQTVNITDDASANQTTVSVDANGNGTFTDQGDVNAQVFATAFEKLQIRLKGGKDMVDYKLTSSLDAAAGTTRTVILETGKGNDSVTMSLNTSAVPLVNAASKLNLDVDLGDGHDTATLTVDLSKLSIAGEAKVTLDGGTGNDVLTLTRSTVKGTAAIDGLFDIQMLGRSGNDLLTVNLSQSGGGLKLAAAGVFRSNLQGGDGNDDLSVNLRNSADSTGTYDVDLTGGRGSDQMIFGVFDDSNGVVLGEALIDGGQGRDTCLTSQGQNGKFITQNCNP